MVDAISVATLAALKNRRVRIHILDRVVQSIGLAGAAAPVEDAAVQVLPGTPPRASASAPKAIPRASESCLSSSDDELPDIPPPTERNRGKATATVAVPGDHDLPNSASSDDELPVILPPARRRRGIATAPVVEDEVQELPRTTAPTGGKTARGNRKSAGITNVHSDDDSAVTETPTKRKRGKGATAIRKGMNQDDTGTLPSGSDASHVDGAGRECTPSPKPVISDDDSPVIKAASKKKRSSK